jgi:hypothetical protein
MMFNITFVNIMSSPVMMLKSRRESRPRVSSRS